MHVAAWTMSLCMSSVPFDWAQAGASKGYTHNASDHQPCLSMHLDDQAAGQEAATWEPAHTCGCMDTYAFVFRASCYGGLSVFPVPVAGTPASAVYNDAADTATTPMGTPVSGNVLSTANVPTGTTAQVTGFSIAGSTQVYPPGSNVTLTDPVTGEPIGTLVLQSNGDYTFDPVPGYIGPTPAISVYSRNSNGVTDVSSLTIDVLPGKQTVDVGTLCCISLFNRLKQTCLHRYHAQWLRKQLVLANAVSGASLGKGCNTRVPSACLLQLSRCRQHLSSTPLRQACLQRAACSQA